ncbi:MAG: heavy metal translocating P-type ATPase [Rhodococcus sp. (in: high G+C Gram-positive bacteria)]
MSCESDRDEHAPQHFWQSRPVRWSALSGLLLGVGIISEVTDGPSWLSLGLFVASTLAGARFFTTEAIEELVTEREIGIELLMTVAAVVAAALGLWGEAASLAFLYSISEALESFTEGKTRNAIRALLDLVPKRVIKVEPDGTHVEIDIDDLGVGDRFLVRPGQNIATDGTVIDGASAVNEAAITGESMPVEKVVDSTVFAGTSNAQGALIVQAIATSRNNTLAAIVKLVEEAQDQQGEGEEFMERFARIYSPAVLAAGAAVAIVGGWETSNWSTWLERAATVIVAATPCALVIAIPVTYVAALGRAARNGILIKGGIHLENLGRLNGVALDKTGTITQGRPRLTAIDPVDGGDPNRLLGIAAAVEQRSEHPLAQAIVDAANDARLPLPDSTGFAAITGAGATAVIDNVTYTVASPAHINSLGIHTAAVADIIERAEQEGATVVVLADYQRALAVIAIEDTIRPNAAAAIAAIRATGVSHVIMLTGDNPRTAATVAALVGITEIEAGLRPADKARIIGELTERHGKIAMVGDGVNDAPALASASVGIAMGTAGSDVALETADVVLMADDLNKLGTAIHIGRRTRRIVRQNVGLSLVILAVLVPGALFGLLALPVAVLAHELSELAVILNGVRVTRR